MKHLQITRFFVTRIVDGQNEVNVDELYERLKETAQSLGLKLEYAETEFFGLDKYSIQTCESCGNRMTNRSINPTGTGSRSDETIEAIIYDGATHDEQILCQECLPENHRWGVYVDEEDL